jgi:ABC-type transporter Mla subunit MlaD
LARLLADIHDLAELARRLTPEIDSTLATAKDLAETLAAAIPKLDELNGHFGSLAPEANRTTNGPERAVPAATTLNRTLEGAVPQAEALNKHLEAAIPLLTSLEPILHEGVARIGPLEGSIDRLRKMVDRAAFAERVWPLADRLSGRTPREAQ